MGGKGLLTAITAALMLVVGTPVGAAEDDVRTRLQDLEKKLQGYEQLKEEVERLKAQVRAEEGAAKQRAEAKPAAPALPDWVSKITPFGDIRVRNETFLRSGDRDRLRQRFRLRFGLKVKPNDEIDFGLKLASGNASDPISNNQTFTDDSTFKNINIANAYLKLAPSKSLGLERAWFTVMGGKFDVPMYTATRLVLDGDLTPEGFFESFQLVDRKGGVLRGLALNLGQWIFQENSSTGEGAIYGFQGATRLAFGDVAVNLGVGDYLYVKESSIAVARNRNTALSITNTVTLSDGTVVGGRPIDPTKFGLNKDGKDAEGNPITIKRLNNQFNDLNVGGDLTIPTGMKAFPVKLFGDYVNNTEASGSDDQGFQVGAMIGSSKEPGDVFFSYAYQRLETDAVVSAFGDSDFGRDGGTNTEGHILQTGYTLTKNLSFLSTAWITEPVDDVAGRNSNTD
ncbi:MAG: putative porin, partial [Deltaproteobacteria bacterium]|nr:putative porin [Deltaproteobacteria bacterium]